MELRHIQYFVTVAEELHFGRAAQRLNISQPPLSQQIQLLEKELGVKLFERTKRDVRLTKAGHVLLGEAYQLLEQSEAFRRSVMRTRDGGTGNLSVGCISTAFYEILPTILKPFRTRYPGVSMHLQEGDTAFVISKILDQKFDLGIVLSSQVEAPLHSYPLRKDKFIVALPSTHPLAEREKLTLAQLSAESFVMCARQISPQFYDNIIASCLQTGFSPKVVYESNSIQNQVGFVACGLAVALVPEFIQRLCLPGVVYKTLDESLPLTDIVLVWNSKLSSELSEHFVESAKKCFPHNG